MKRLGKVFFGVLCMILLLACSHTPEIHWVETSDRVKIAWDATTTLLNGNAISNPEAVGYFVYISKDLDKNHEKNELQNEKPINKNPITKTIYEIKFPERGQYIVGVQAALYKDGSMEGEPEKSNISWSCSETCTNKNPFGVKFK